MATIEEVRAELKALRAKVALASQAARAANDPTKVGQLGQLLGEIDDELDDLAIEGLAAAAARLGPFRQRLEVLTQVALAWPFGSVEAPQDHERPFRAKELPPNDFADAGPTAPPPASDALPSTTIPQVSAEWSENYRQLWNTLVINADWQKKATAIAQKIIANQPRYAAAVDGMPVPWWFVSVVHSMECSMRFDQHLHNGDPLSGRTTHVPAGRPLTGGPSFTWEQSARDAIQFERLDRITDWSLPNVLFNWHRYNGINNEYKRRGIPTPYLWSGSTHYKKGKYVADGVFDPEFVSQQVGAAVILKALVDLGAVKADQLEAPAATPAAASPPTATPPAATSPATPSSGAPPAPAGTVAVEAGAASIPHIARELAYPGLLKLGAGAGAGEKFGVKRVQEWLRIHGFAAPLDSGFGSATSDQLKAFQASRARPSSGELDEQTWDLLTAPMRKALVKIESADSMPLDQLAITIARQHLAQAPIEVGGNNLGPWVRLYMAGNDGADQLWCAGFVCFVVAQACRELKIKMPFERQVGVPSLVRDARASNRLVNEGELRTSAERHSKLKPGYIFAVRDGASFSHTGFVLSVNDATFDTVEGNTGKEGGRDGANARQGSRPFAGNDFIRLN
ncbi:MAG: peptidoglycan-binding protein [Rhodospirillales bacterium]|nr:peptidoglycan-binding protein [Rhodospirillales bacterium]